MTIKYVASDKDTHFTGALATNAIESESLNMPTDWITAGVQRSVISELSFQSDQNLDWELIFWSKNEYDNSDLDLSTVITRVQLDADSGQQIAGAGQYIYKNPLLQNIGYLDEDNSSKIHVSLINRDATSKNAGATGEVVIRLGISPWDEDLLGVRHEELFGGDSSAPSLPVSGARLWFDASQIDGVTDGGAVGTWRDESGDNHHATGVNSPTYQTDVINGRPVVRFDGVNQHFTIPDFSYTLTGLTVFVVAKHDNATSWQATFSQFDATGSNRAFWCGTEGTTGRPHVAHHQDGDNTARHRYFTNHLALTDFYILSDTFDAGTTNFYINGLKTNANKADNDSITTIKDSTSSFAIGGASPDSALSSPFDGDIAELIMFDSALSDANRQAVQEYLSKKYNIGRQDNQLWNPTKLSGLVAWFNAEQGGDNFNADTDSVASWASWHDEGTSSLDMTEATASEQPTFQTNEQNGRPIVRFDGVDDGIKYATGFSPFSSGMTVILALGSVTDSGSFDDAFYEGDAGSSAHRWRIGIDGTDNTISAIAYEEDQTLRNAEGGTLGAQHIIVFSHGGSGGSVPTLRLDGTQVATATALTDVETGSNLGVSLGARVSSSTDYENEAGMDLCESLIFDRELTATEITLVETWLNNRWSIF